MDPSNVCIQIIAAHNVVYPARLFCWFTLGVWHLLQDVEVFCAAVIARVNLLTLGLAVSSSLLLGGRWRPTAQRLNKSTINYRQVFVSCNHLCPQLFEHDCSSFTITVFTNAV